MFVNRCMKVLASFEFSVRDREKSDNHVQLTKTMYKTAE